jgi:hypothetical protein
MIFVIYFIISLNNIEILAFAKEMKQASFEVLTELLYVP